MLRVDVARGHLFNQVLDLLADPGTIPDVQRFARHLVVELPALFGYWVWSPLIPTVGRDIILAHPISYQVWADAMLFIIHGTFESPGK